MDLDEMKCSLCQELYNEKAKTPMLLPDCGHSFCLECISEQVGDSAIADEHWEKESLTSQSTPVKTHSHKIDLESRSAQLAWESDKATQYTFKCPECGGESKFNTPQKLPKNFAIIKVIQKQAQAGVKHLTLTTSPESDDWVVKKEETKQTVVDYLRSPSPTTSPRVSNMRIKSAEENKPQSMFTQMDKFNSDENIKENKKSNDAARKSVNFKERFAKTKEALQQKQNQELEKVLGICPEHDKLNELVCLSGCKRRVCSHCALFGSCKGHEVREEHEVQQIVNEHAQQLEQMVTEMRNAQNELIEPKFYWKYANMYREKKENLKNEIQQEFKAWRKTLRSIEMKILDDLHSNHFPEFEERFAAAKQENQSALRSVTSLIDDTQAMLDHSSKNLQLNKHYIEYELTDPDNLDKILSRAEDILENVLNLRDFQDLEFLDEKYNKISVRFDAAFETMAMKLVEVHGVNPKSTKQDSVEYTQVLSFKKELEQLDQSQEQSGFDITRISDSSEQKRAHLVQPGLAAKPQFRQSLVGGSNIQNNLALQIDTSDNSGSQKNTSGGGQLAVATTDDSYSMNISSGYQPPHPSSNVGQRMFAYKSPNTSDNMVKRNSQHVNISDQSRITGMMSPTGPSPAAFSRSPKATSKLQQQLLSPRGTFGIKPLAAVQEGEDPYQASEQPKTQSLTKSLNPHSMKAGAKRVSKESAISTAFSKEVDYGILNLNARGIGDTQINEISKNIQKTQWLKELNLSGNKITDKGLDNLAKSISSSNIQMDMLNLSNNKLTDKSMEPVAGVLRLAKGLRGIDLRGNGITNRVARNKLKNTLNWMNIIFD